MEGNAKFLQEEEKISFLVQLLNAIDQAILIVDENGQIKSYNRFAETLYGRTGEDLKNTNISEIIIMPSSIMEVLPIITEKLLPGDYWSGDFLVKPGDGPNIWVSIHVMKIMNMNRTMYSLIGLPPDKINRQQLQDINQLLVKIDTLLTDGADYEEKLTNLAQLIIPVVADWCFIHLLKADETVERVAIVPAEIVNTQAVYEWVQNDLPNDESDGLPVVLQSGKSILIREVSPLRRASEAGIKSYMIIPLVTRQQMYGAITLVSAESDRHFTQSKLTLAENLAIHIAAYLEKSQVHHESKKLNQDLEERMTERTNELSETVEQLKQSEEMLQTLFRLSNKLNATLDVEQILDMLAQEAIQIVNGESGFAGLRTAEGMTVHRYFQQGVAIPFEHIWALGEGIPGWVLKYKVPYGTSDAENDPLIRRELPINANVHSIICTPILDTVGEVIAYFDIRNKQGAEGFTISDQEMLLTLAPVASIAIQNALAYQQRLSTVAELKGNANELQELAASLESAREEERTQVARELHDQLGQALTAMKFDLSWLTEQLEDKNEALAQKTKDITAQLNTLIKAVRRIATELRSGMLDDLGLVASIEWQAHDFEKRTGIKCKLNFPGEDLTLTHDQSLAIYRIFQEALTNVARYAEAKYIEVTLSMVGDLLTLELHDDGRGIKEEEISGIHSLGLLGMRERAKHLGGAFEIHGVPDQGTTVKVSIPINKGK